MSSTTATGATPTITTTAATDRMTKITTTSLDRGVVAVVVAAGAEV